MTEKFFSTFSKYIQPDNSLILAVSGGVDSMVLLDLVLAHHPREKIIVAHFDHSLRGVDSDGDREFIANYCNKGNIICEVGKMDIAKIAKEEKMSIESVARKYRYEFLETIREKYQAKYILTAHHQDDRIETMMFNLIRGAKLGGIHALSLCSGKIFRPLLHIWKSEILEYAREKNISHREDISNTDTDYLRNHLRINILPEFVKINPEYRKSLENFIEYSEELKDWIDGEISSFLSDKESFSVRDFEKKSPFFQKEIIRYLYEKTNGGTVGLSEGNIEEMLRYIIMANGGTSKEIGKLRFMKKRNTIFW